MIIIDTREPSEYGVGHVDGAINVPPAEFMQDTIPSALKDVPFDDHIMLYCRSGQRSNTAIMKLRQHGFTNLTNGINEHRVRQLLK